MAAFALLVATMTGALAVGLAGSGGSFAFGLYFLVTLGALWVPAAITVQLLAGQVLMVSLLLSPNGPEPLFLIPVMAGVVTAAELLTVVARLDSPLRRVPVGSLAAAGRSAGVGALVFGVVLLLGKLPGPAGMAAVVLASTAVFVAAHRLTAKPE